MTAISGLASELETVEVTTISEPTYGRHQFIPTLYGNDGNITLTVNVNPTSRDDWEMIRDEFAALTGGLGMWFEFTLPTDTMSQYFRCIPGPMPFPDIGVAEAAQGDIQLVENKATGWTTTAT